MTNVFAYWAVELVAERQFGLFTTDDAIHENISRDMLVSQCRAARYRRVAPRVYAVESQPADWRRPIMAALLSAGGGAVASHRSAAALLGLDGVRPGTVEISVPGSVTHPGWIVHRRAPLPDDDLMRHGAIWHTKVVRTLLDLGRVVDDLTLEQALESALRGGSGGSAPMTTVSALAARARGTRLRRLLDHRPAGLPATESELETRFVQLVRSSTMLEQPHRQFEVIDESHRVVARMDLAWPGVHLFVELDGIASHRDALFHDRHRQNLLVRRGWRPLRHTWDDVVRRPRTTLREVEQSYREAAGSMEAG